MTNSDISKRLIPQLMIQGEQMTQWLNQEIDDSLELILNYLNANMDEDILELPLELYWIIKKMIQVAFNRQRSEGLKNHSEGGEILSWGDNGYDPLEPFVDALNDYIDGSSKRNSWDFF